MAQLLPNGRQQFLDANGNPLAGGLVYFYIPNTTTPKDTWQDAAKSALNTNPVVCDARGQATIYGDGDYRQILQDAAGNSIWDKTVSAPVEPYVYDQGTEPTTDIGDIWINGVGACRWDAGDSKYYLVPYQNKIVFSASGSWPGSAYVKQIRVSGCAGGAGGTGGIAGGTPGIGGLAGQGNLLREIAIAPGHGLNIVIGAGGVAPDLTGGNTVLSDAATSVTLLSLSGGNGTYAAGGSGGANAYQNYGGPGQSSIFGMGGVPGTATRPGGGGSTGAGGGGGSNNTGFTAAGSGGAGILILEY